MNPTEAELIDGACIEFEAFVRLHPNKKLSETTFLFAGLVRDQYILNQISHSQSDAFKAFLFKEMLSPDADLTSLLPHIRIIDEKEVVEDHGELNFLKGILTGKEIYERIKPHASLCCLYATFLIDLLG